MMIMAIIFRINPIFNISVIFIFPVPKTSALGPVAAGNINAIEAAKVTDNINSNGFSCVLDATPEITGSIISVVAVLEVNSVRKTIKPATAATIPIAEASSKPANCFAKWMESPDLTNALAMANPPPNKKTIFQGIF